MAGQNRGNRHGDLVYSVEPPKGSPLFIIFCWVVGIFAAFCLATLAGFLVSHLHKAHTFQSAHYFKVAQAIKLNKYPDISYDLDLQQQPYYVYKPANYDG